MVNMMNLAKRCTKLFAILAISLCLVSGAWAQAHPAKKHAHRAKPAPAPSAPAANPAATAPAATAPAPAAPEGLPESTANKRDPFMPLLEEKKAGGMGHLPPGKAGLMVSTVHVDGTVQSPDGMIAVVSNPERRVYFIREGDQLYDGEVEKIGLDGVTFRENSKDAFGKPIERTVTKRLYASAGEEQ